jgi:hypothetical protein
MPEIIDDKDESIRRSFKHVDLDKDFEASAARIEELRAGRDLSDIPLHDHYWKAVNKHKAAHGG